MKQGGPMIFRRFFYGLKEGIRSIFRNKMFSLASIGTTIACVFLIGVFLAVVLNVRATMKKMEQSVGMSVFFEKGISKEEKQAIGEQIQSIKAVESVQYVSGEEAWENYKEEVFEGNEDLLEGFEGANPLDESDSYEITLDQVADYEKAAGKLQTIEGVRKVKYSKVAAEGIEKMNTLGTYVAAALIFILFGVSIFLVSNTVSVGVSMRKEEIAIMKLIGAANGFVKAPFRMEGMIIGLIGSAIPMVVIYFGYHRIISWVTERFYVITSFMEFVSVGEIMMYLIPAALLVGLVIGVLGSSITIRRYLSV